MNNYLFPNLLVRIIVCGLKVIRMHYHHNSCTKDVREDLYQVMQWSRENRFLIHCVHHGRWSSSVIEASLYCIVNMRGKILIESFFEKVSSCFLSFCRKGQVIFCINQLWISNLREEDLKDHLHYDINTLLSVFVSLLENVVLFQNLHLNLKSSLKVILSWYVFWRKDNETLDGKTVGNTIIIGNGKNSLVSLESRKSK